MKRKERLIIYRLLKMQLSLTLTSVSTLSRFSGGCLKESNQSRSRWSRLGTGDFDLNVHHPACRAFPSLARFWRVWELSKILPCEQTLRGAVARGGKRNKSWTTCLEFEFHLQFPCSSPLSELSIYANQREAETSANVNKLLKTRAKGNDVITNVFSANQHFASTFRCTY